MGYTTDFTGKLKLTGEISQDLFDYINAFASTRRMKRSVNQLYDKYRGNFSLNGKYGEEGEFFIGEEDFNDKSVLDFNCPPTTQPGLWAQWILIRENDNIYLEWDEGEKFYDYIEWLKYYIKNFFDPNDITLNGEIEWQGEDPDDFGKIIAINNQIEIKLGKKVYD